MRIDYRLLAVIPADVDPACNRTLAEGIQLDPSELAGWQVAGAVPVYVPPGGNVRAIRGDGATFRSLRCAVPLVWLRQALWLPYADPTIPTIRQARRQVVNEDLGAVRPWQPLRAFSATADCWQWDEYVDRDTDAPGLQLACPVTGGEVVVWCDGIGAEGIGVHYDEDELVEGWLHVLRTVGPRRAGQV